MRIVRFEAENLKRLKVVEITPHGDLIQITGKNGAGKSSVLDAIWWAIDGARHLQKQPIRAGETKARIKLDLGELVVERRFTDKNRTGTLVVETPDGAMFRSPQKMLDELVTALTLDPLAFSRMDPKAQYDALKWTLNLDVDFDRLDAQNRGDFDRRRDFKRRLEEHEAQLAGIDVPDDAPDEELSVQTLLAEVQEAQAENTARETEVRRRADRDNQIKSIEAQIAEWQKTLNEKIEDQNADDKLGPAVDVSAILARIDDVERQNKAWEAKRQKATLQRMIDDETATVDGLTKAMKARTDEKHAAIAAAKLPVDGLSLGDGLVLLNDLPFDQASDAERLRVSTAIAMAQNPKLRVLRIRDGSLLDEDGLALLGQMATDNDYQIWIERVETGPVGIVMEDGMVAAIDGEKVEPPAQEDTPDDEATGDGPETEKTTGKAAPDPGNDTLL